MENMRQQNQSIQKIELTIKYVKRRLLTNASQKISLYNTVYLSQKMIQH